jgi:hypothetical protein
MKIIVTLVVLPLLFLAALGLAAYQMVASIPPWLVVVVIVYLLCRRRRPSHVRLVSGQPPRPAVVPPAWTAPPAQPALAPQPPVVVVLVPAPEPAPPRLTSAPEPWLLT